MPQLYNFLFQVVCKRIYHVLVAVATRKYYYTEFHRVKIQQQARCVVFMGYKETLTAQKFAAISGAKHQAKPSGQTLTAFLVYLAALLYHSTAFRH
jgi:hypothetical protein